jgi:hypothetical protein
MSVYVDQLFVMQSREPQAFRTGARHGHQWCHMWADTDAELHQMAGFVGMKRAWFQNKSLPHYDLVPPRRAAAIAAGARESTVPEWKEMRYAAGATVPCYLCAQRPQQGGRARGAFICVQCFTP